MSESLNQVRGVIQVAIADAVEGKVDFGPRSDEISWYLRDGRIVTVAVHVKEAVEILDMPEAAVRP